MVALIPLVVLSQTAPPAQVHKDKMHALAFLVGDWSGEGWQTSRDTKIMFKGTESARWSAGGTALLIEGHQTNAEGAERYNGLVILTWNAVKDCYRLAQQTSAGTYAEYDAKLTDKGLVWKLRENLAMTLAVKDGEWLEEAVLTNGDSESKIFELRMKKKAGDHILVPPPSRGLQ